MKQSQQKNNNSFKNTLKYGFLLLIIFLSASMLLISYGYFISLSNGKTNKITSSNYKNNNTQQKNPIIKRVRVFKIFTLN